MRIVVAYKRERAPRETSHEVVVVMLDVRDSLSALWAWLDGMVGSRVGAPGSSASRLHELGRRARKLVSYAKAYDSDRRSTAQRMYCENG